MSEPQLLTPAALHEYLKGLHLLLTTHIEIVKHVVGDEVYEKAEKAVEQEAKEAAIRAQNLDPRVETLAQEVSQLRQAIPQMAKSMAAEFAKQLSELRLDAPQYVPQPPASLRQTEPPLVDASEEQEDDEADFVADLQRERRPQGNIERIGAPAPEAPNTAKGNKLRHDRINRAVAPGKGQDPLPSIGGEASDGDE